MQCRRGTELKPPIPCERHHLLAPLVAIPGDALHRQGIEHLMGQHHAPQGLVGQLRPGNPAAGERSPRQELTLAGLHAAVGLHEHQLQPGRQIRPAGRQNSGQLQGKLAFTGSGFHQGQGA